MNNINILLKLVLHCTIAAIFVLSTLFFVECKAGDNVKEKSSNDSVTDILILEGVLVAYS